MKIRVPKISLQASGAEDFVTHKQMIGVILSLGLAVTLWFVPLPGDLSPAGRKCLVVTVFTVTWWVFYVTHPAYSTLLMFIGYILFDLATPSVVFRLYSMPMMWLMIGAFLIAAAVTKSGLALRLAYFFMTRYANSYGSIVVLAYIMGIVLSLLIPHPFPRTLLIMAPVSMIIEKSGANQKDAASLGLAVFVSATSTSMILLTGDAMLNLTAISLAGVQIGWLEWIAYMGVPGLAASILMLGLHFLIFKQSSPMNIDRNIIMAEQKKLGPMKRSEKVTMFWISIALILWATDFAHHINPSWIALGVVVGLSLPKVGDILTAEDISTGIAWPIVIFVVGALAIGTVSNETGLSRWLSEELLPSTPPDNPFRFAAIIAVATIGAHMVLGSALACMSIITPSMVEMVHYSGWSPLVPALIVYTAVQIHYLFPFQHVTMLLGAGKTGKYSSAETVKYGLPLTIITMIVIIGISIPWWKIVGLI